MKLIKYCILGFAAAAMVSACSDDRSENGGNEIRPETGDGVYMELSIEFPQSGSRSGTVEPGESTDGTEVGTDAENAIQSVAIVLADTQNNGFIAASTVGVNGDGSVNTDLSFSSPSNSAKAIAKINKSNLSTYYNETRPTAQNTRPVNVFVFCNPTQELIDTFKDANVGNTDWLGMVCNVIESSTQNVNTGIWGANNFVMSNKFIATRLLPLTMADWDNYKTKATAFDLSGLNNSGQLNEIDNSEGANGIGGAIDVQRVVARFDFKDGSDLGGHRYHVVDVKDPENANLIHNMIDVQLLEMAFSNMCNKFYYLPRTSSNGLPTGNNFQICGRETKTNYLVGPYATIFSGAAVMANWENYFNYPFFNKDYETAYNSTNWNWKSLVEYTKDDYKFWRYSTENLIPGEVRQQRKGITTTVVFKGKMIADEWAKDADTEVFPDAREMYRYINNVGNCLNPNDANQNPILYSYNGNLYLTWPSVRDAAILASVDFTDPEHPVYSRYNPFYTAVFGSGGIGEYTVKIKGEEVSYNDNELNQDVNSPNYLWEQWQKNLNNTTIKNNMRAAMVASTFTLYETSNDATNGVGYYCYYFYQNRHNDNELPGTMGPMEFCVVRNNVYKLAVTKLSKLGHPLRPSNDPDDPKPDDPDESDDIYLTVTCRVLPWVVRINNIQF